ncbi:ASCH domain-containing protein [Thalassoroseus pseudoceratinae]|uniref:ASCH domain-containing protein n=1 Tax=Thalassoroseus pseudoceratinae TaxID=2713176 RepID=UPI00141FEA71|nr:ASCH domain-containing protein [Thalassoroseus pseudoceratinae]
MPKKKQTVRVLSIRQPYADLILSGDKPVENRTWQTKHRGRLYIHASRWHSKREQTEAMAAGHPGDGSTQAIIGYVDLTDITESDLLLSFRRGCPDEIRQFADTWDEDQWHHVCGPYCWIFQNPVKIEPIEGVKGKLNLWPYEI